MVSVKQTNKIGEGKAGPGRPKGVPNKATTQAKEAIAIAAEGLGGSARLKAWAAENEKNEYAFWTIIYPKLVPLLVGGDAANPVKLVFEWLNSES